MYSLENPDNYIEQKSDDEILGEIENLAEEKIKFPELKRVETYTKLRFSIDNLEDLKKTQSRFTLLFSIQKMKREMKGNINKHVVSILKAEGPISSEIS